MLGARRPQQLGALAIEEHDRADVDVELHVDVLGLVLVDRGADPHAGVVDEDVEPAEGLAVAGHDGVHRLLVREVRRDVLDLRASPRRASAACSSGSGLRAVMVTP